MKPHKPVRICVPVCETNLNALETACRKAIETADLVELRLDYLQSISLEELAKKVSELAISISHPLILTLRPEEQGGHRSMSLSERILFWRSILDKDDGSFFDWELDLVNEINSVDNQPQSSQWSRVICSHHDFTGTGENLEDLYRQLRETPAGISKIAIQAKDIIDCLPVFRLLDLANAEHEELIAIAMGNAGLATRILGPSRGSFLTYGSSRHESATAPGQLTAEDLTSRYRIRKIERETEIYGLVGTHVMHSVSPHIHNAAFESQQIDAVYLPFEVHDVGAFLKRMVHPLTRELDWRIRGLSITAPHKSDVIPYLDWIEATARDVGAVNTVVVEAERLLGYNTDVEGFIQPLLAKVGSLNGATVAVIGAGGAARAAIWALRQQHANVTLFVRDLIKGRQISERSGVKFVPLSGESFAGYDVVVNATPLGSPGAQSEQTAAVAQQLKNVRVAYDLVYNPIETRFLQEARDAGCETLGGLAMLVAQAARQFELWTRVASPTSIMTAAATNALRPNLN